ncbi:hypothetical protein L226DRAFT_312767 [Lentinus tigrinus ALCF2SS1-7]|uniref:uncharacterized protein n=1 Tax=Lentinus tigrinus ALCF2SS1-7 TaxID=1328758 RepID=UPI00116610D5|nr:hypothetical protein L226DRAFT_312767 [Lentinus tigrinus ALCF2SS1-7]
MSASPQPPAPATVPARDEPAPQTNGSPPAPGSSPAQLAALLAKALEETDSYKQQLDSMRRRADKAERLLASFQSTVQSPTNGSPPGSAQGSPSKPQLSEAARKTIMECENRAERAEQARDEAEARLRMLQESWVELDRFFAGAELRNADVRAQFTRLVAQGGGELITIPAIPSQNSIYIPSTLQQPLASLPSRTHLSSRSVRGLNLASQPFPSVALPPPPSASSSRVRPRAGSMDAGYAPALAGPGAPPPAKRPRSDRDPDDRSRARGYSISPSNSPHPAYLTNGHAPDHSPQLAVLPSAAGQPLHAHPRYQAYQPRSHVDRDDPRYAYPDQHRSRRSRRSRSRGRSSRSRSRASSMSLDEMLLEATAPAGDDRAGPDDHPHARAIHPSQHLHPSSRHRSPSPGRDYHLAVPHHSRIASPPGPLPAPGQVQTYQTHIFAPPVTGAPVKKPKHGAGSLGANGSVLTLGPTGSVISGPSALGGGGYPPTNAAGQRICRQCGLPGRYKDGKCVEKWGPGPEGPGTVCDRCRKKMKRVERRGTLDSQNLAAQMHHHQPAAIHPSGAPQAAPGSLSNGRLAGDRSIHRTDTIPIHPSQQQQQQQSQSRLGPGGTQILSSQQSYSRHDHHDRDRERDRDAHSPYHQSQSSYSQSHSRSSQRGPTPPGIATLPGSSADGQEYDQRPPRSRDSQQMQQMQQRAAPAGVNGHPSRSGSGSSRSATHSPPMRAAAGAAGKNGAGSGSGSGSPRGSKSSDLMDVDADGEEVDADADADAEADEVDADADADPEGEGEHDHDPEGDADADAELLEAVDAAEANAATDEEWLKKEDA